MALEHAATRTWTVVDRDVLGSLGPWRLQVWNFLIGYVPFFGVLLEFMGFGEYQVLVKATDNGEEKFVVCAGPHKVGTILRDGQWKYEVPPDPAAKKA